MKKQRYQLRLKGLQTPPGTIGIKALIDMCGLLMEAAERGLRLAVEGNSIKPGRMPVWLSKSLELTVTGLEKGSTVLDIEAPVLGETARNQIRQQDLWYTPPKPDDTALTLVCRSVHDTTAENLDSDMYDGGVLASLLSFRPFLKRYAERIDLRCQSRARDRLQLDEGEMEKIRRLRMRTPQPRALLVSGLCDVIEHNRRRFRLVLNGSGPILGVLDPEFLSVEHMRRFWGKRVTIKGMVHFRASGRPRLIEAQVIKPMEQGEEIFQAVPYQQTEAEFMRGARQAGEGKDWLKNVWGKWPGDESAEELLAALKGS
ncbi:MAG: hypothetical protein FJ279_08455 [Planctomycetes bacterium]|nr:hypothetical protein [Planctomycetota bacterium]MBM4085238.1 hypothetical protein [Planctomycetota bacterium]